MNTAQVAALILVFVLACVGLFQVALVLGAPMGEYAFGGRHPGKLPIGFRIGSAATLGVYLAQAGHYLAQAGLLAPLLDARLNGLINWAFVGLFLLGLGMNSISRSQKERRLWVPVLLLSCLLSVLVALG